MLHIWLTAPRVVGLAEQRETPGSMIEEAMAQGRSPITHDAPAGAEQPPKMSLPRVLLVDDQPFFLAVGRETLSAKGYEVHTASSGAEALNAVRVAPPDAILLDVAMPGMDGIEICRRLKADPATAGIPVIIHTALRDPRVSEQAMKAGADAAVMKSVNAAQLLNMLQVVLATAPRGAGGRRPEELAARTEISVILAEPDPTARLVQQWEFERAGFTVFAVDRAEDLDRCLNQRDPYALVIDRSVAGPSGEVVRRVRERLQGRQVPCFVLAVSPSRPDRQALLQAGADWYIDKNGLITSLPSAVRAELEPTAPWAPPPGRVAPRLQVGLGVEYLFAGRVAVGETFDISQTGMFVKTSTPPAVDSRLLFGFSLPGGQPWQCFARVVWNRPPTGEDRHPSGMAVQFLDLDPEAQATLADFILAARCATPSLPASRPPSPQADPAGLPSPGPSGLAPHLAP